MNPHTDKPFTDEDAKRMSEFWRQHYAKSDPHCAPEGGAVHASPDIERIWRATRDIARGA